MTSLLDSVEHATPIIPSPSRDETRATECSRGATRGDWNTVWSSPIVPSLSKGNRQKAKAKAANEAGEPKGEVAEGPGLFDAGLGGAGSVAAE